MGYYIETAGVHGKAQVLVEKAGAERLPSVPRWEDIPEGKALICVVDNGIFEAAGFAYSFSEYMAFTNPDDFRTKEWLLMDRAKAEDLSGFNRPPGSLPDYTVRI